MFRKSKVRVEYGKVSDLIDKLSEKNQYVQAYAQVKDIPTELGAGEKYTLDGYYYAVGDEKSKLPIQWSLFHEYFDTLEECQKYFKRTYKRAYRKYWWKAVKDSIFYSKFKWKVIKLNFHQVQYQAIYSCGKFVGSKATRLLNKKILQFFYGFNSHTNEMTGEVIILEKK